MSELEEKNPAIEGRKELEEEYQKFLDMRSTLPKLDAVSRAEKLLRKLRYSGKYIIRPQYRDLLSAWCRNIGAIIFEATGDFPSMRILPLEIREALGAARENTDLVERVEDMVSVAPFLPVEEKRAIIAESIAIAYSISNDEDRAKALKAISNEPLTNAARNLFAKVSNIQEQAISGDFQGPAVAGSIKSVPLIIPHQVPFPPLDFTGRENDVNELLAHFSKGIAIIGLRGMGGVGKSTLAFALAKKLKDRFPDGQLFISMRGTSQKPLAPAEAMAQVIRSYHPTLRLPQDEVELANLYRSVLDGKRSLLLFDDSLDDEQVRPLLPPIACGMIITSRRKFKLPGMVVKDLEVFTLNQAVEFLLKLVSADSTSGPSAKRETLEELARLCGCLPVALRAAGSFLSNTLDTSPEEYIIELRNERNRLSIIGREGVDEDVGSKLSLSYGRLEAETARVFRGLSIFPSDFDAQAEEKVCQDEGHRHLSELLRWSLVEYQRPGGEGEGRYRLHDLVRLFAAGRLEEDGGEAARNDAQQRHAEYFRGVLSSATEHYKNGDVLSGLRRFDLERINIEAGWAWAKRNLAGSTTAASICNDFLNGSYLLELRMHPLERISWLETALAAARQLKYKGMEGVHLGNLGMAYADLGDARKAIEYQEQYLTIAREIGDRRDEGNALGNLGSAFCGQGDARKAIEYHEQALAIDREIGFRRGEGADLGNLGLAYADLGDARKAIEYYEQGLAIACEIGDRRGEGNALWNMSLAMHELDKPSEAIRKAESALEIYDQIESPMAARVRQRLTEWRK